MTATAVYRRGQFSIKSLLLFIGLVACCLGLATKLPFFVAALISAVGAMAVFRRPSGQRSLRYVAGWSAAAFCVGAGSFAFWPLSLAVPLLWFVLAGRRDYLAMGVLVASSPVGMAIVRAVSATVHGEAVILGEDESKVAYLTPSSLEIIHRPEFVRDVSDYWIFRAPHNQIAAFLYHAFGPMPGEHSGDYPRPAEAIAAARGGVPLPWGREVRSGQLVVDGRTLKIDVDSVKRLVDLERYDSFRMPWEDGDSDLLYLPFRIGTFESTPVYQEHRAALWKGHCLLIWGNEPYSSIQRGAVIVIDRRTNRCVELVDADADWLEVRAMVQMW